jgi:NAD-dependent dihydropyrimidine dehydrogenase PreA subunit/flavodoxin
MKHDPKRALVLTYSQTGHTALYGRLIAAVWKKEGLSATASDIRKADMDSLSSVDLIAVGTPVFYWDVPQNVIDLLSAAPLLNGTPVAAFCTYGGEGGNQHNTARRLLKLLEKKGGLPVGMDTFGGMSSFAPTWSLGNEERVLKYRNRPDEETFDRVREFAGAILANVREGRAVSYGKEFFAWDFLRGGPGVFLNKLLTSRHAINRENCTRCGVCAARCPVGAIDLEALTVDRDTCISCLGCVNNCPVNAVDMAYLGKQVWGFAEFKRRFGIVTKKPAELVAGGK